MRPGITPGHFAPAGRFLQGLIEGIKKKISLTQALRPFLICVVHPPIPPRLDPFQGRYFLSVVVLVIALLDISCSKRTFQTVLRYLLVLAASAIIVTTHLFNEGKPVAVIENIESLANRSGRWTASRK